VSGAQPFRLAQGGRIDRERPLRFTFNGRLLYGCEGDTLASALLANGVRVVARSFKFHRPRGILSCGAEEPNALLEVGSGAARTPNVRATLQPLYNGLSAASQNCWPGVDFDLGRCLDWVHPLWPAGFYHKTFMWPGWHWYEWLIRRAAGLGRVPPAEDSARYVHRNAHCDVLVCGAGPAGLAAAQAAAEIGARVILVEQDREPGGSLLWREANIEGQPGAAWAAAHAWLAGQPNVTVVLNATVSACFDHRFLIAAERIDEREEGGPRERLWRIRAGRVIFATGAIEQPPVFPDNDRPGIVLASAVHQYLNRYAVACGRRVVLATANGGAYAAAAALLDAGIEVAAVIDARPRLEGECAEGVRDRGVAVFQNAVPVATRGARGVHSVAVARRSGARLATLACDCLAVSGGWQPAVHLFSQARGTLRFDPALQAFVPDQCPEGVWVAGAANGATTLAQAIEEGRAAGRAAARADGSVATRAHDARSAAQPASTPFVLGLRPGRQWVDLLHDVTLRDIGIAVDENFIAVEHLKRFTTIGMAADQGKTGNLNALLALARFTGRAPGAIGTTTFRPFYLPVTLGAIAGRGNGEFYAPVQRSPLFETHERAGAQFRDYGHWRRPAAYPRAGESFEEALRREARAARTSVAVFDGSSLGKIEVRGRDAAEFLDRIYVNDLTTLAPGRARYGLMQNENGVIIDDGICVRLDEDTFLVHTTSGGAGRIHAWMEALAQGDWPDLDVLLTPVGSQWANVAVSGPRARELIARLGTDVDLADAAFPYMSIRTGTVAGVSARLLRASFTGELGFELNVPADFGAALWAALLEAGAALGATPIGVEALMVLRIEKGYLHIGADTDGNTTALDVGWGPAIERKRGEFLGRRSLARPATAAPGRLQFVGLTAEPDGPMTAGAHVLDAAHASAPAPTEGYVTSACFSPNLGRWVALGLVRDGRSRIGERVHVFDNGQIQAAVIAAPGTFDPAGERLRG
jgi:sarcosine oxidase subunit alpha